MNTEVFERKLSAILSADVAGYSRLMGQDDDATVRTLTGHREMMSALIKKHRGRVVDSPGDNLLAEFGSARQSVECAAEIQRELAKRNAELPEQRRLVYRIGLNVGDVIKDGDRIYGNGVNIAARIESLAEPGGICISGLVFTQVKSKLKFDYEFIGKKTLKNISEPIPVYRVRSTLKDNTHSDFDETSMASLSEKPSIAVLPFTNMSNDPDQDYFSDGITEDLITNLTKISDLFVIARNSVFVYKGKAVKIKDVAQELGVRYILEGSIQKAGDRVRITSQLIDAISGGHLWAERYDRDLSDIFELQDEVTSKIVTALAVKITEDERGRLLCRGTSNLEAYDTTLHGWKFFIQFKIESNIQARHLFEKAIQLDPDYALAYSLIAGTYMMEWTFGWSQDPRSIEIASKFIQKSLKLDDSLYFTYRIGGDVLLWKKQHEKAISFFKKAIALNPNDADGLYGLSEALNWAGYAEKAKKYIKKAMQLNPIYPVWYLWALGHACYLNQEYEEAIDIFTDLLDQNPNYLPAHPYLAAIYQELGRKKEATLHAEMLIKKSPFMTTEAWKQRLPYKDKATLNRLINALQNIEARND